jgi:hypothetical protein
MNAHKKPVRHSLGGAKVPCRIVSGYGSGAGMRNDPYIKDLNINSLKIYFLHNQA